MIFSRYLYYFNYSEESAGSLGRANSRGKVKEAPFCEIICLWKHLISKE